MPTALEAQTNHYAYMVGLTKLIARYPRSAELIYKLNFSTNGKLPKPHSHFEYSRCKCFIGDSTFQENQFK